MPACLVSYFFFLGTQPSLGRDAIYCLLLSEGSAPWSMTVSLTDTQTGPAGIFTQGCFTCVPSIPCNSQPGEWQARLVVNDTQPFFRYGGTLSNCTGNRMPLAVAGWCFSCLLHPPGLRDSLVNLNIRTDTCLPMRVPFMFSTF